MPLVAAAVVPHPPLLLPELAGARPDADLAALRSACHEAVGAVAAGADMLVVVGDGPVWGAAVPGAEAGFAPWGAPVRVELPVTAPLDLPGLPEPAAVTELPLSLVVAAWLLAVRDRARPEAPSQGAAAAEVGPGRPRLAAYSVPPVMPPGAAAGIGRALAAAVDGGPAGERRAALLVLADGTARRTERSPGTFHPGADAADAAVAKALAGVDLGALRALDPATCAELWLGGRVPLQVMAGALADAPVPLAGRVLYEGAPAGVGYFVATCLPAATP